jgi:hypothetical protein
VDEVVGVVDAGTDVTVANVLAVPMADRPGYVGELTARLAEIVGRLGRPHAVIVDEAHHAFSHEAPVDAAALPAGLVLVSNEPGRLQPALLETAQTVVAVGDDADRLLDDVARARETPLPPADPVRGDARAWWVPEGRVTAFVPTRPRHGRRRHAAKMVAGDVGESARLVVTGPDGALALDVRNLSEMVRIAAGVDEATWAYHCDRRDWSRWVETVLGDAELAGEIRELESHGGDPGTGRKALREAVVRHYPEIDDA